MPADPRGNARALLAYARTMNIRHSDEYLVGLVREFCKYPRETEWVEFKRNNADPQQIDKNISALANSAALEGKPFA